MSTPKEDTFKKVHLSEIASLHPLYDIGVLCSRFLWFLMGEVCAYMY